MRRRKLIEGDFSRDGPSCDCAVVLQKCISVRAVSKRNIQYLGVSKSLLQAGTHRMVVVLGFDNCDWKIRPVGKHVINLLSLPPLNCFAANDDSASGEVAL